MFGTVRFGGRRLAAAALFCLLVFIPVCAFALGMREPDSVMIGGAEYPLAAESGGDVEAFISACGYIPRRLISDDNVTVPKEWNGVYESYNELQKAQGLGLDRYRGRKARLLVYSIVDSPLYATVMIIDGRIAAAHMSPMDGSKQTEGLIK